MRKIVEAAERSGGLPRAESRGSAGKSSAALRARTASSRRRLRRPWTGAWGFEAPG